MQITVSVVFAALGLIVILYFLYRQFTPTAKAPVKVLKQPEAVVEIKRKISVNYGQLLIFFASQTGTAAKMAEVFSGQAEEQGFKGDVIDLKDITPETFNANPLCVFFMSNTGEGEPPDNCVRFIKILTKKIDEYSDYNFKGTKYTVFGLGNTQYQFYNKIGKDTDKLMEANGAKRIYKLGLGDNNASMEDDFNEWKADLWKALQDASVSRSMTQIPNQQPLQLRNGHSEIHNNLAKWKFIPTNKPEFKVGQEFSGHYQLEFLTKGYLHSQLSKIIYNGQVRQNTNDGSTIQVDFQLLEKNEYKTAGNLAIYPENDPQIINRIMKHFKLDQQIVFDVEMEKKTKLNFCTPIKMRTLLTHYIDLQEPITKSVLKKLSKLPSKNSQYFLDHSSPKTTEEFKRLSTQFHYIFQLIEEYQVDLTFETFVELSRAMAPRLFTIASSPYYTPYVQIADSLEDNGLCSKFLTRKPTQARVEVKESSFNEAMKLDKVIFVSAGTGFAPFRAYLQEKQVLMKQGKSVPLVSLIFGCRHQQGDFIYREEIKKWIETGVINKFYPAFSRDQDKKIYVQNVLEANEEELRQLFYNDKSTLYICGSTQMGAAINDEVVKFFIREGKTPAQAKQLLLKHEKEHKIIKELW